MTTAVIQIDQAALAEASAMLTDVRNGTDRALAMAINRVAPRIRTAMSTAVRQQVALRAAYVNAALELQKARIGRMRASISTPEKGVPLVQYMISSMLIPFEIGKPATTRLAQAPFVQVARGGNITIVLGESLGGVDQFAGAWVGTTRRGITQIFTPVDPTNRRWGRPIRPLYGPSISQVLSQSKTGQTLIDEAAQSASDRLPAELLQAATYLLTQQAARVNPDG